MRHGIRNRALVGVITLLCLITASGAVAGVVFRIGSCCRLQRMLIGFGALVATRLVRICGTDPARQEARILFRRL
jgi:hypothetical protein